MMKEQDKQPQDGAERGKGRRLRIGVIFGGRSGEHEVSLMSARSVLSVIDREKFTVVEIGVSRTGQWLVGDNLWTKVSIPGNLRFATSGYPVIHRWDVLRYAYTHPSH